MISHKFREVMAFADDVQRAPARASSPAQGKVADLTRDDMAAMMIGSRDGRAGRDAAGRPPTRQAGAADQGLKAKDQTGTKAIAIDRARRAQPRDRRHRRRLRQRPEGAGRGARRPAAGRGRRDHGRRHALLRHPRGDRAAIRSRFIPEEPLRNACAPRMAVAENLAFRTFDVNGGEKRAPDVLAAS